MSDVSGSLLEIFVSIQGEGLRVGSRQLFVRFFGCNLSCRYCDTASGPHQPSSFPVDLPPFSRRMPNPADPRELAHIVADNFPPHVAAVTLTGGEPLLQPAFILAFIPALSSLLRGRMPPVMLETNGVLPDALAPLAPLLDTVAMDVKLPSMYGGPPLWGEHERFIGIASHKTFVKVVVGRSMTPDDFDAAVTLVARCAPAAPFFIQPVWPVELSPSALIDLQLKALERLPDVKVIVQQHALLGMR
ncbi:MAG TPA: 7-carboxy-7-deazaguanine synthase QueE [Planctomycetes bacterium]|nr:7-carboxy-7-deazaguanine synthase QueE [Planctomycetota bacterium]